MNLRLYVWQRLSAAVMVPLLVVHIATIYYATSAGLSGTEILARTQGSIFWAGFYGLFVAAAAIHAGIGLRSVASDWTSLGERVLDVVMWGAGLLLLVLGLRAVLGVIGS